MTPDVLGTDVQTVLWLAVKGLLLVGLIIYMIFASVIVRQVNHMTATLEVGFETPIRLFAWLHLLFALGTFLVAFVVL